MQPTPRPTSSRRPLLLLAAAGLATLAILAVPIAGLGQAQQADPLDQLLEGVARHLELSDEQRSELDEPMRQLFELLPEVQRLHTKIAVDLNEKQREGLANIVTAHVGTSSPHGGAHGGAR